MARPGFRSGVVIVFAILSCLFYLWPRDLLLRDNLPEDLSIKLDAPSEPKTTDGAEPTTRRNNGLTNAVEWDEYSLFIHNQRVFIWSGEFHPWRLPVANLWIDVLQKMKAAGLNAVSIYIHWGLVNPAPGVFDFDGYRSLQTFYDAASEAGLWVILRPGPYINAETTAGGIPHWVTSEVPGHLRTNNTAYREAWTPYIREIARLSKHNQITEGGPIIAVQVDNEYSQKEEVGFSGKAEMMRDLEDELRAGGIVVPLTYNDARPQGSFVKGVGAVDIYGLDSYPQRFDCSNPTVWNPVVENYHDYHIKTNPKQPWFTPEFQGGAFDAWGPNAPGYDACRQLTNEQFESVFFKNLYAANFKLINIYMMYGGTTWGHLPFPGVYTSYDYGAPISESRQIESPKYAEIKRQALFIRSTPDFYRTEVVGNSSESSGAIQLFGNEAEKVFVTQLRNPISGANFYVARSKNSTSNETASFSMNVEISDHPMHIPASIRSVTIPGRQSLMIVSDLRFGRSSHLLYSTAEIMWAGTLGDRDALVLYGSSGQWHEAMIRADIDTSFTLPAGVSFSTGDAGYTLFTIQPGVEGLITLIDTPHQIILYLDTDATTNLWLPPVEYHSIDDPSPFEHYWQFGTKDTLLVHGPHLVRRAVLQDVDNSTLALYGDLKEGVRLQIMGWPKSVRRLRWNDHPVEADFTDHLAKKEASPYGSLITLHLEGARMLKRGITLPKLEGWVYSDSLPEIFANFSDADWIVANRTTTNIPEKPLDNGTVLYGCDYGFCEGIVVWRGYFTTSASESKLSLVINGGAAFAASVWVNDHFLGTSYGNSSNNQNIVAQTNESWSLPHDFLRSHDNVVTVIQDNMGLEETGDDENADYSRSPRGIRLASLIGGEFTSWKVQGKRGGYTHFPDRLRGIFNEGGSYGERQGWHLPDADTLLWPQRDLALGIPGDQAGLGFFVTHFDLNIPLGFDVPISLEFEDGSSAYRALLFVNGWMMGKRVANIGPQTKFPVHEGILNYHGKNTLALLVWAMEPTAISPKLSLKMDGLYDIPF